jgi:Lrp/AsnC family transcriptional regulator for asnA, asnC and gidA
LEILKNNCRHSAKEMAEQLNVHANTISSHIKKLEEKSIIQKYEIDLNYRKLGYLTEAIVYVSIKSGYSLESKAIEDILNIPGLRGIGAMTGKYNLVGFIIAKDLNSLLINIKKIECNQYVLDMKYELILSTYKNTNQFNPLEEKASSDYKSEKRGFTISKKDISILNELLSDARLPYSQMSEKHNIPISTIKQRIDKMEQQGIINRFSTNIDYTKLGFSQASLIKVKLDPNTKDGKLVVEKILQIPQIINMHSTTGDYNYIILLISKNNEHLIRILKKFNEIPQITNLEVNTSYKRYIPRNNAIQLDDFDAREN